MSWVGYALVAIALTGFSDLFRKLGSHLKDPFFANLLFQSGAFIAAIILYSFFSRTTEHNPRYMLFAFVGGLLVATFTLFSFKALATGPGVSTVMPTLRVGGVTLVTILGVVILREKLSVQSVVGIVFSIIGIYLLFSSK